MSMYIPEIKEEVSAEAKMLVVEEDGKVYKAGMQSAPIYLGGVWNSEYERAEATLLPRYFSSNEEEEALESGRLLNYDDALTIYEKFIRGVSVFIRNAIIVNIQLEEEDKMVLFQYIENGAFHTLYTIGQS